ncbi:MAG: hypothetical protein GC191_08150 [Azospirillum sp.]|nr:hypothetical protein [Azospirillum sp.]
METALALIDTVTAHLDTIVLVTFAVAGAAAQIAARFDLDGLARASRTAHDLVQLVAGNWGKAANAAEILRTYRTNGFTAALDQLDALSAGRAPTGPAKHP